MERLKVYLLYHHGGFNILGLLETFGWIGLMFALAWLHENTSRFVAGAVLLSGNVGLIGLDIAVRIRHRYGPLWSRLLIPSAGGSLFFVPFWLSVSGMWLSVIVLAIIQAINKMN
jgi:hypothetical protein